MNDERISLLPLFIQEVDSIWQRLMSKFFHKSIIALMKSNMMIKRENCEKAEGEVKEVLRKVEGMLADGRRYLFNTERLTAADITFGALMSVIVRPPLLKEIVNVDLPAKFEPFTKEILTSPAGKFALRLYEEDRGVKKIRLHK
eukprot:TRINITY_DN5178_c0_g2_i1.p1 TRINITY_DN5178_c0_g2~~TRINITY_DN5178_c0_g2_i1.p1  ORF type:complete len:144 (+),score=21.52 TRINITY_DN5178_c0_g2_i1:551-982(+)